MAGSINLKIVERQECVSKHNGQKYALLRLRTPQSKTIVDPEKPKNFKRIMTEARDGYVIGFEESNSPTRKGQPDYVWNLQEGDLVPGDVVTRFVQEYIILDEAGQIRISNTATVVVFGNSDEPDWEEMVRTAFFAHGFVLANPNVRKPPVVEKSAPSYEFLDADSGLPL